MLAKRQIEKLFVIRGNDWYNLPKDQRIHEKRNSTKATFSLWYFPNLHLFVTRVPPLLFFLFLLLDFTAVLITLRLTIAITQLAEQTLNHARRVTWITQIELLQFLSRPTSVPIFSTSILATTRRTRASFLRNRSITRYLFYPLLFSSTYRHKENFIWIPTWIIVEGRCSIKTANVPSPRKSPRNETLLAKQFAFSTTNEFSTSRIETIITTIRWFVAIRASRKIDIFNSL